jgi:hypothetical protein
MQCLSRRGSNKLGGHARPFLKDWLWGQFMRERGVSMIRFVIFGVM